MDAKRTSTRARRLYARFRGVFILTPGGEGLGLGIAAAMPYRGQNGLLLPLLPNLRLPFLPLP